MHSPYFAMQDKAGAMQPSAAQPPTHAVNIEPEDRASVGEGEEEGPRAWCSWSRVHFLLVGARYTVFGGLFALMGVILAATAPGMILWHNSLSSWCYFAAAMVGLLIAARMVNWLVFKPLEKLVHSWAWQLYFYFSSFDGVLTVVLWAAASLAVFERYMSDTTDDVEFVLVRLLWSAIIVSICTGFRRLLVKMLAISATRRDFESQVAELTFHQHALQCMCDREAMVPANVPRHVRWLSQLRNKKFKLQVEPGEKRRAITSGKSARSAAKRIFQRIDWHNRGFLTIDNFLEYLSHEDAARVFTFYDVNEDEQVALQEFTLGVESLFLRWASISTNLRNRESLSRALDFIISIVFWFLMLMVVLLVLNVDLSQFLVLFSSMIISFSFAFGATAQRLVLSLLFVFVYKCYDVGDRVRIADSRRTLVVTKVGVFVTQFRAITNEVIYFPNHQLAEMHIENLRRSTNATINVNIHIAYRTTAAQVAELERRLKLYVRGLPDVWRRDASVYIGDVQQHTGIMLLDIWVSHHINWQHGMIIASDRTRLVQYLLLQLEDLKIAFTMPQQPVVLSGDLPFPHGPARSRRHSRKHTARRARDEDGSSRSGDEDDGSGGDDDGAGSEGSSGRRGAAAGAAAAAALRGMGADDRKSSDTEGSRRASQRGFVSDDEQSEVDDAIDIDMPVDSDDSDHDASHEAMPMLDAAGRPQERRRT